MASKITDDMIKGQWKKQNDAHDAEWNAIAHMAQELGLTLDKNGNVVERKEKEQTVAPSPSVPSIDMRQIKVAVKEGVKEALPPQATQQSQISIPPSVHIQNNKTVLNKVVEQWMPVLNEKVETIAEAYGIAKDAEEPPIIEERILQKIVKVHKFIGKILRWIIEDMMSCVKKFIAYNIAFCCALFAAFQYYQNQQLLTQSKKDAVIRYILSGDPANKAMIEKIDSLMFYESADKIWTIYTKNNKHK